MYFTFIHLNLIHNSSVYVVVLKEQGIFSELPHRALSNLIFSHLKFCHDTQRHTTSSDRKCM